MFIGIFSAQFVIAQYPLSIRVEIAPPYPIRVSDFTSAESNIFVTVENPTQQSYKIFLSGTLRNEDRGMTISTDPAVAPGECIDIMPGGRRLTGVELNELFDPERLVYTGTTINVIRGDQALPEGTYTLCLRAESCDQRGVFYSPVPGDMDGCSSFDVVYVEPPEISAPDCEGQIDVSAGNITMQWLFTPPAGGMGNIRFRIEMVELDPISRDPRESMNSSPRIFETEDIDMTAYNLLISTDVPLVEGHTYVFRVIAYDPDEIVQFRNHGESDICTFQYGEAQGTPMHPRIITEYPLDGDVIPFSFFPLIVKFDPYDDHYKHFTSDVSLLTTRGVFDDKRQDLNWPNGPLIAQRNVTHFPEMTEEQSQYQAIYKTLSESPPAFSKKDEYTWNTDVEMIWKTQTITIPRVTSTFKVGMGPSKLSLPENGDTVQAGLIKFKWVTAEEPQKILPDFSIVHATRATGDMVTFFNGIVDERWLIEISNTDQFDSIVHHISGRLGANIDLNSNPDDVKSELYKSVQENFTITKKGTYYWRVKWMNSPNEPADNTFYTVSEIFTFVIDSAGSGSSRPGTVAEADTVGGCISVCLAPPVTDRTAKLGLAVGDNLKIGKFTMVVQTLSPPSGTEFTGDGYVQIPFLNSAKIKVDFRDIQYNSLHQIFSGTVKAAEDRGFLTEEVSTRMGQVISMAGGDAEAFNEFLTDGERLLSGLSGAREIGMPIGIDREIDGNKYTIGIVKMEFTPERATINAVMNLNFPEIGNSLYAFGAKDLCITPNGLGDEGRLYLARDWDYFYDGETKVAFKGAETADTTRSCYINWDCHGFLCARIQGEVTFPRSMLVPDREDGTIGAGNVKGSFSFKTCRGSNFITSITFDPFQIKGVDGWGWVASNAWLDFSDMENPAGFHLPDSYADTALLHGGSRMINTWHGFYMENIEVRAPAQFEDNGTGNRITFGVHNTIIDGTGFTASIRANNILPISRGTFKGWSISLDTINIDFVSNVFRNGGISGKFGIPIFAAGQHMNYRMALTYDDDKLNYLCRVFTSDTLTVNMWAAKMHLRPDSEIRLQVGDSTYASANLSGDISINGDVIPGGAVIPGINFKGMVFEGLRLSTSTPWFGIDSVYFSYASPQKTVAGFPVSINNIKLNMNEISRPGIDFDLDIVLSNFSAHSRFGVFGRLNYAGGRLSAGFDGIDVEAIEINQVISGVKLRGGLEFYKSDPTYGNGLKGYVAVTVPMDISANLTVQFGTKRTDPAAVYGTAGNYPYWFVDGLVTFPGGIPIFAGFGIYGFGGGVYNNMRMDVSTPLPAPASTTAGAGGRESVRTSVRYVPAFGNFGMKLSAVMGTQPSSDAFNMDATLEAAFNHTGGLELIQISAAGYIMASISERSEAKVWANVSMGYHIPADGNANFHGDFDIYVKVGDLLKGVGTGNKFVNATFHADRDTWYFYMGRMAEADRGGLNLTLGPLDASLKTYLMVGYGIPSELPPPPEGIRSILYGSGAGRLGTEGAMAAQIESQSRNGSDLAKYSSATGFAFGVSFDYRQEMDFAIFYADLGLILGFDLNVTKDDDRICAETGDAPGINDWYSTGQVYAGLTGEMGVKVDLWFISGKFPFINLKAAVLLKGGLPNPSWFSGRAALQYSVLSGLVEGRCSFEVNVGRECTMINSNPLGDLEFIYDVRPQAEDSPVSVFEQPRVSFNLPIEKILEFPAGTEADPSLTRRFKPFISSYKLMKNDGRNIVVPGTFEMSENNTIATYRYEEALESTTSYKIEIVIQANEYFRDGSIHKIMKDGSAWEERREETFTTQLRPDQIVADNVLFTYPVENQKFFLKGETKKGVGGLIRFNISQSYLFYTTKDGSQYSYLVRFKSIPSGDPVEVPLQLHGSWVDFLVPPLDNEKMYTIQFIRKRIASREEQIAGTMGGTSRFGAAGTAVSSAALTPLRFVLEESTVTVKSEGTQLPGVMVSPGEHLLYNYYFKTSRYNSLQEKLNAIVLQAEYKNIFVAELFDVRTFTTESFDDFEIHGVFKNGIEVLKPLLGVTAPFEYSYHTTEANPYIYTLLQNVQDFLATGSGIPGTPGVTSLNSHGKGKPPVNSVSFGNGFVATPLSQQDVEAAAGINRTSGTMYTSSVSNASLTGLFSGAGSTYSPTTSSSVSSFAGALPADPSNFRLYYETSNYVMMDFNLLKGNVSRILSATVFGTPVYRNAMQRNNPTLLDQCNQMLRKTASSFKFSAGEYGIEMFYRAPTPTGNLTSVGARQTKTFSYGSPPLIIPGLIRFR